MFSSLAAHNPRVATSIIRRTFQCNTDSRQAELVQWPDHPSGHDSVGTLEGALFIRSSQEVVALWGFPWTVGLDGVSYSLFKVPFPWWQRALLNFFNLVLSWGVVPILWKRSIVVPVFIAPSLSVVLLQTLRVSGPFPHWTAHLFPTRRLGGRILTFVVFVDLQKTFDTAWIEGTLVCLHEVGGDRADVGISCAISSVTLNLKFELVHLSPSMARQWDRSRESSLLLFNLLIDTLASDVRQLAPGVRLLR